MKHYHLLLIYFCVGSKISYSQHLSLEPTWTAHGTVLNELFGGTVAGNGDVNGDGFDDIIVSSGNWDDISNNEGKVSLYLGSPGGPSLSPAWVAEGNQSDCYFGRRIDLGDINGDGYADILVGSHGYNVSLTDDGAAFIYYGGPDGPSELPDWMGTCNETSGLYGCSVSCSGDINNDGFDDIVIGASGYGTANTGAAFVYLGSPTGPTSLVTLTPIDIDDLFGYSVDVAGDINGDGFDDILVGEPGDETVLGAIHLFFGLPTGISTLPGWSVNTTTGDSRFGIHVKGIGDVNGDGFDEIMTASNDERLTVVYYGSSTVPNILPDWYLDVYYNSGFDGVGDINGDGFDDMVLMTDRDLWSTDFDEKEILIFAGSENGLTFFPTYIYYPVAEFGGGIVVEPDGNPCSAGDVNGDGFDDWLIGFPQDDIDIVEDQDEGSAKLYFGGKDLYTIIQEPMWNYVRPITEDEFGTAPTPVGDIDNDGINDFMIAAPKENNGNPEEGVVRIYKGSPIEISEIPLWTNEGNYNNAWFGISEAGLGDINNDGFEDIAIGAKTSATGGSNTGRVHIFLGNATGFSTTPSLTIFGDQLSSEFGYFIEAAGDVNNDNYDDFLVSASTYDNGHIDEGKIFLYLGSATINADADWTMEGGFNNTRLGEVMCGGHDINNDGFDDIVIGFSRHYNGILTDGEIYFFYGSPAGISTMPNFTLNTDYVYLGNLVEYIGDVNGDNYDDLFVGNSDYGEYPSIGASYIYFGGPAGISPVPNQTFYGNSAQVYFALGRPLGDINNDGYDDIRIYYQIPTSENPYYSAENYYYNFPYEIFLGSAFGIRNKPSFRTNTPGINYSSGGIDIALGDVTGDGIDDFMNSTYALHRRVFTFPDFQNYGLDYGAAYLYNGRENSCGVTSLLFSGITNNSVTISIAAAEFERIDYRYRKSGTTVWTMSNSLTTPFNISALDSCSTYEIQAQLLCVEASSPWGPVQIFTTAGCTPTCSIAPTGLSSLIMSPTKVKLSWLPVAGATKYKISYKQSGAPSWTNINATTTFKTLNGLTPGANYQWKVKAICGGPSSPFSPINLFTTPLRESDDQLSPDIKIYPNPNNGSFNIYSNLSMLDFEVTIYNNVGESVYFNRFSSAENIGTIILQNHPPGLYLILIKSESIYFTEKIIITP